MGTSTVFLGWPETAAWPNRSKGKHWTVLSGARKRQRKDAEDYARTVGLRLPDGPVIAVIGVHPPTRRRYDLDNTLAALKGALDGLVTAAGRDDSDIAEVRIRKCSVSPKLVGGHVTVTFIPDDGGEAW